MFECSLRINGITDEQINETFSKTLDLFEKEDHRLRYKVKFVSDGKITIHGVGKDRRCAFCEYFRQAVVEHFKENNTKGSIDLIDCPFNPDKTIDYSPETVEARKRLIDLFVRMKNKEND